MQAIMQIQKLLKEVSRKKVGIYAANASFFILLSIFPAMMLFLSLLQYTPLTKEAFLSAAEGLVPSVLEPLLHYVVTDLFANQSIALISFTAITTVWSASRGVYSLLDGLNVVYGLREHRGYLFRRLVCMLYTLLLFAALLLTVFLYVFGQRIRVYLAARPIPLFRLLLFFIQLRWLVVSILLTALFTMIFLVFPDRKLTVRAVFPGAAIGAVGWVVFSSLFSFYVNRFGGFSRIYGSLSVIAVSMLWLYFCLSILFYSALFNVYLERWRAARRT